MEIKGTRPTRKSMQLQINIITTEHHTLDTVMEDMHRTTTAKNTLDMEVITVPVPHKDIDLRIGITMNQRNLHFKGTVQKGTVEIIIDVTAIAGAGTMVNKGLSSMMKGTMVLSTMATKFTQHTPNTNRSQLITKTAMAITTMDRTDTAATKGMGEDPQATGAVETDMEVKDTRDLTKTDINIQNNTS